MSTSTGGRHRPRILMMTDRVPGSTSGYGIRVANMVDGLVEAGDLHLCVIDSSFGGAQLLSDDRYSSTIVRAAEFSFWRRSLQRLWTIPNMSYTNERELTERVAAAVGHCEWDLVWFSRIRVHRLGASVVTGAHVLDLDDLNDQLLTSLAADRIDSLGLAGVARSVVDRVVARRWRRYYRKLVAGTDLLVVTHDGDRELLGQPASAVVPNGYPTVPDPPAELSADQRLLFVGPLSYEPNYLAVRWLVDEVLDRVREVVPEVSLSVVGDLNAARSLPRHEAVEYHGFVDDLDPIYQQAAVVVTPLRSGAGTRIKILEAMARRRPLVSTSFAADGLGIVAGEDACIADTVQEFVDHCVALLTDPERRSRLADHAHRTFMASHTSAHSSEAARLLVSSVLDASTVDGKTGTEK